MSLESATKAWGDIAKIVAEYEAAWSAGGPPPEPRDYASARPEFLRRLALIELVKADMEQRAERAQPRKAVEQYIAENPELVDQHGIPCELVYEEFQTRRRAGDAVSLDEYAQRFPQHRTSLQRMAGFQTTRLVKTRAGQQATSLVPGQEIDDFELIQPLGEGAFAKVFLARQKSMHRLVALKVSTRDSEEPQTMAQLDHANIVRVYDQRQAGEAGMHLVYMEHVAGGNLQMLVERARRTPPSRRGGTILVEMVDEELAARGEPPLAEPNRHRLLAMSWNEVVCWIGGQLAFALDYAHRRRTLHRDVKPANVLLAADGVPKLVDFNVAYSSRPGNAGPAAYFGGSLAYMSPEQLEAYSPLDDRRPEDLDGRSDIYSLGLVLWELLTGWRPFEDEMVEDWTETVTQMIGRRREGVPTGALAQLPHDLPPGLREALLHALSGSAERRYANAADMGRELALCLKAEVRCARQRRAVRWCRAAQRHPLLAAALIGVLPNAILSIANVTYDWFAIVMPRLPPEMHPVFFGTLITLFKSAFYVVGVGVALALAMPAFRPLMRQGSEQELRSAKNRSLRLGDIAFWVSLASWISSGIVFPAWLDWAGGAVDDIGVYAHFFASHLLCGLLAGTATYFLMTLYAVRVLYAALLDLGPPGEPSDLGIEPLRLRLTSFGRISVMVPFLAALILAYGNLEFRAAIIGLAVLGMAILAATFRLTREIQRDLDALQMTTQSQTELLGGLSSRSNG